MLKWITHHPRFCEPRLQAEQGAQIVHKRRGKSVPWRMYQPNCLEFHFEGVRQAAIEILTTGCFHSNASKNRYFTPTIRNNLREWQEEASSTWWSPIVQSICWWWGLQPIEPPNPHSLTAVRAVDLSSADHTCLASVRSNLAKPISNPPSSIYSHYQPSSFLEPLALSLKLLRRDFAPKYVLGELLRRTDTVANYVENFQR